MNLNRVRWTLTAWYVFILLLIVLTMAVPTYTVLARTFREGIDNSLMTTASRIAERLDESDIEKALRDGGHDEDELDEAIEYLTGSSGDSFFVLLTTDGRVLENPLAVNLTDFGIDTSGQVKPAPGLDWRTAQTADGDYRLLSVPVRHDGETIAFVQVGRSLEEQDNEVQVLAIVVLATGGLGLVLATVGGFYIAGRALRPPRLAFERQRQFIADASHEMRTPLTLVRASAEAIQRSAAGTIAGEDRDALADIITETDRLAALVTDMMSLAVLDEGRPLRGPQLVEVSVLLEDAGKRASALASGRPLSIELEVAASLLVVADRDSLSRVLDALVENAVRYTPDGGRIRLSGTDAGPNVEVSVGDTGPGLTAEEARSVFHRFYRTDSARSREHGGSGLGLAIAKAIVERHGGQISVKATPGSGATFTFVLPRAAGAAGKVTDRRLKTRFQD